MSVLARMQKVTRVVRPDCRWDYRLDGILIVLRQRAQEVQPRKLLNIVDGRQIVRVRIPT